MTKKQKTSLFKEKTCILIKGLSGINAKYNGMIICLSDPYYTNIDGLDEQLDAPKKFIDVYNIPNNFKTKIRFTWFNENKNNWELID